MILAKQLEFDVYNALDCMENTRFFDSLKFVGGDNNLPYPNLHLAPDPVLNPKPDVNPNPMSSAVKFILILLS